MKILLLVTLFSAMAATSACDNRVPKSESETRPPMTQRMDEPPRTTEPSPAPADPVRPRDPTQAPLGPNK